MSEHRIIEGYYVDMRPVRTRKVLQIMVEVPLELAGEVTKRLGWPYPVAWTPCYVSLKNTTTEPAGGTTPKHSVEGQPSSREAPPAVQPNPHIRRAMALAGDTGFWNYLRRVKGTVVKDRDEALGAIKTLCGFASRSDLVDGSAAAASLRELASSANAWQRGAAA